MVDSTTFHVPHERDAWSTVRGYTYQIEVTIARWLDIQPGELLELEPGDDVDLVSSAITATGEDQKRILEQVKLLERGFVTLHSTQVLTAIAKFYAHRLANPNISLRFRFTTNSRRGREPNSSLPTGMFGLDVWEGISRGTLQALPLSIALTHIRSFLRTDRRPSNLPENTWRLFQDFVKGASDEELSDFIHDCEWSTGTIEALDMRSLIQQQLQKKYRIVDNQQAEEIYARLFLYLEIIPGQIGRPYNDCVDE